MSIHIIKPGPKIHGRVEICRSFSYKMNAGNYESRDFFMSQKVECDVEDVEEISEKVYAFCKAQVLKSVREYNEETNPLKTTPHKVAASNSAAFEAWQGQAHRPAEDAGESIDIGPNQMNTQAAADYVAQKKIAEMKGRKRA